ncbi:hypothetical protein [Bacillus massilinigeriensis]|uniref:hypothetical protein n=1 Tax=Bacillus mediterraneensis TaxID=1805474 RepID=UPI00114D4548|nr:hypothetical protein [Bacillus mediterraneensis]
MDPKELSNMRLKQVAVTNGIFLIAFIILFVVTSVFTITTSQFNIVLGAVLLLQSIYGLIKGETTKSLIPIFERVANYEKQKMGREWNKQQKVNNISRLILSFFLFFQAYSLTDNIFEFDYMIMFIMTFFILVLINISLIYHFRKVDRSTSEADLKGYTRDSYFFGIVLAIVFLFLMVGMIVFYLF